MRVCERCGYSSEDGEWVYVTNYGDHICEECGDSTLTERDFEENGGIWFGTEIQEGDE